MDLEGDHINAKWDNGAIATLKVQNWDPDTVILIRYDHEGVSAGLSARYQGQINRNMFDPDLKTSLQSFGCRNASPNAYGKLHLKRISSSAHTKDRG